MHEMNKETAEKIEKSLKALRTRRDICAFVRGLDYFPRKEYYLKGVSGSRTDAEAVQCLYSMAMDMEGMVVSNEFPEQLRIGVWYAIQTLSAGSVSIILWESMRSIWMVSDHVSLISSLMQSL